MAIVDRVSDELKQAMRAQNKDRITGLRQIRAAFIEAMKVDGAETLADDKAEEVLRRLAKQRRESIEAYEAGGRQDLADQEKAELAVVEGFLPQLADEETTRAWVDAAIAETGATTPRDMGKVMSALMAGHKSELDGKLASRLVKERLQG
ncbi:MAG: GatB/YqeY domain-containing protein [Myxococcota bacterium]